MKKTDKERLAVKELKESMEAINKTAGELINDIDRHFAEICKERGIDLTAENRAEAPVVEQPTGETQTQEQPITETPAPDMLPDAQEQTLDEYPMPDRVFDLSDLEQAGYLDGNMLPLTKERAAELFEKDLTVYAIVDGGQAEMMLDMSDIENLPLDGVFAVSREEWEGSRDFDNLVQDRKNHQEKREAAFLAQSGDCFAIYQLKDDEALWDIRFEPTEWLKSIGRTVERENYDLIYTAILPNAGSVNASLNRLWEQFNNDHPADYHSPSMSVSDIVAIKRDGQVSCHYVDSFGFTELTGFLPVNPSKNVEMSTEDNYGMIAGQKKQKSVVEQLKAQPQREHHEKEPKKNAEREL